VLRVVVQRNSAAAVAAYFAGGRGEYYAAGVEEAGWWGGTGAERLGLAGPVEPAAFAALCRNERPDDVGCPLTPRTNRARRVGYDFTFNCPKSLSVLYGLTEDPDLLRAFLDAVTETMKEIESSASTRVRVGGCRTERRTGSLVWATFVHATARPVDGWPDPHLHCHAFVFNATWDPAEGRWKAVDLADVKRDAPYFEAAFHARLAGKLRDLGFDVVRTPAGWEIAGVPERVIRHFSRRTAQVEARAEELGVTDPRRKDSLGAKTRGVKRTDLSAAAVQARWWSELGPDDARAVLAVAGREVACPTPDAAAAREAVAFAVGHCFERRSVVPVSTLLAVALRHGVGQVTVEQVHEELARAGLLLGELDGRTYATTVGVLLEERRMLAFARGGRGACRPLRPAWSPTRDWLSPEQRTAVRHVLESFDRVILIRGAAGTGKTALMREAVEAIEAAGVGVVVLAPSAAASRGVLWSEGFPSADTVARFLVDEEMQEAARGQVVWVDEAGLLGARTMARLFAAAEALGARVVLCGDARQHGPVERGAVFRLLQAEAGLPVAEVTGVRRQRGRYKEVAELLGAGQTAAAFDALDRLGWVREAAGPECERAVAAEVLAAAVEGKSSLVVCPTHAAGRSLTEAIRGGLREAGRLDADEHTFPRLEAKRLTAAEKRDAGGYRLGDVVEFAQNATGFFKGSRHRVVSVGPAGVIVRDDAGDERPLPTGLAERYEVYAAGELRLAVGDRVRVTKNGRGGGTRLDNGALFTVAGFTPDGDILTDGGVVVARGFAHLDYGYVTTSHAAQGKTVDRVFVVQPAESFPAASPEQFYVSATRGRELLLVFTDAKAELRERVQRTDPRPSAIELLEQSPAHPARARHRGQGPHGQQAPQPTAVSGPTEAREVCR